MRTQPPLLTDRTRLGELRARLRDGDRVLAQGWERLRGLADAALAEGPFTVTAKAEPAPSGDRRDYVSRGPYWWPDPQRPDGLPWIRRDGERHPDAAIDGDARRRMEDAVGTLALAWWYGGDERHAEHATTLLRTWFLDPGTAMRPHLRYAQGIPGRCEGRGIGIIDTMRFPDLLDAVLLLAGSRSWRAEDDAALQAWFRDFLGWLRDSAHGQEEARERNNHGTWYDVQIAAYARYLGEDLLAREVLTSFGERRIGAQVAADGRQPLEEARTRSLSYCTMNLLGLCAAARIGASFGLDLWSWRGPDGAGIAAALARMLPYWRDPGRWPLAQIAPFDEAQALRALRLAAPVFGGGSAETLAVLLSRAQPDERLRA